MEQDNSEMPPEAYANISAGIVGLARNIVDSDFQHRIWICGSDPKIAASYEETLAMLFDDYDVKRVVRCPDKYGFTENQAEKLRLFVRVFEHFYEQYPGATSPDVVGTEDWRRVQEAAAHFIIAIDAERIIKTNHDGE